MSLFGRSILTAQHFICGCSQVLSKRFLAFRVPVVKPPRLITPIDPNAVDPEGLFSPSVLEFIEARCEDNGKGRPTIVTDFFTGEPTGMIPLNDLIFGTNPRIDVIHQVVVWQRACARKGTASTKTRGEVRGGGRKPWPQKGTGRARQGSIRAPTWRGGGVSHGPKPRSYAYNLPLKVQHLGMRAALSSRFAQGDLYIVDNFDGISPYEEDILPILEKNGWENALLVDGLPNNTLAEASSFIPSIRTCSGHALSVLAIMDRKKLVMSVDAVRIVEDHLYETYRQVPTRPNEGMAGTFNPDEDY